MKKVHSIHAAKTQLSRLVERACAGEEVVIARGKTPVAKLVRADRQAPARRFGSMRGRARVTKAFFAPLPLAGGTHLGASEIVELLGPRP